MNDLPEGKIRDRAHALELAQAMAWGLVDQHIEVEPCISLLDFDGQLSTRPTREGEHPLTVLTALILQEPTLAVAGVVVVCEGNGFDVATGEPLGRIRTIQALTCGRWATKMLSPQGITDLEERPQGLIPEAMTAICPLPPQ